MSKVTDIYRANRSRLKRAFDFAVSTPASVTACPVIAVAALTSAIDLSLRNKKMTNPFFLQTRIGKDRKPFTIYKLQTMTNQKDENGNLLDDDKRVTLLGKFLRATKIDELPQLYNIMIGDMSLVGSRPAVPFLANSLPDNRFRKKPGLFGAAQNELLHIHEAVEIDVAYAEDDSLKQDLVILSHAVVKLPKAVFLMPTSGEGQSSRAKSPTNEI